VAKDGRSLPAARASRKRKRRASSTEVKRRSRWSERRSRLRSGHACGSCIRRRRRATRQSKCHQRDVYNVPNVFHLFWSVGRLLLLGLDTVQSDMKMGQKDSVVAAARESTPVSRQIGGWRPLTQVVLAVRVPYAFEVVKRGPTSESSWLRKMRSGSWQLVRELRAEEIPTFAQTAKVGCPDCQSLRRWRRPLATFSSRPIQRTFSVKRSCHRRQSDSHP